MRFSKPVFALVSLAFVLTPVVWTALAQTPAPAPAAQEQPTPPQPAQETMSKGEYLARVGNCVACHTVAGGQPFAGGLRMAVPSVGFIYTTNITPDPDTGIGGYTFEDFDTVMRSGKTKDGHRLYPAMPYPSYAKTSADDMHALYDYFMKEVKPVKQQNHENETHGMLSARWLMSLWNLFFLHDRPFEPVKDKGDAWNRGAYLAEALGHCGACHTERGWLFQEKGLDHTDSDFLAGASLDHWSAPPLNGDINSGLGRMSEAEVAEFLKTGKNKFGTAFGTMVDVINNSTEFMTDADLQALATFLKSLPPKHEKDATPYQYDENTSTQLASFQFEKRGSQVYYEYCTSCHGYDGHGFGTLQPGLAGNPVVLDPNPDSLINLTLNGSLRIVSQGQAESFDMPHLRTLLPDQKVADVVSFIRTAWGNNAKEVDAKHVTEIREATNPVGNNNIVVLRMK